MSSSSAVSRSAETLKDSKQNGRKEGWAQAPAFLRMSARALQQAMADVDFKEEVKHSPVDGKMNPFLPPPIPGVTSSASALTSPEVANSVLPVARHKTSTPTAAEPKSAKKTPKSPTIRVVRQPIQRKIVSARPDDLESEEELDTDMEMDVTIVEPPDEDETEDEAIEASVGDTQEISATPEQPDSPMSTLTTPPPSDEEDDYLAALSARPALPAKPAVAKVIKGGKPGRPKGSASKKASSSVVTEVPLSDLVSAEAPRRHPLITFWKLEGPSLAKAKIRPLPMLSAPPPPPAPVVKPVTKSATNTFKVKQPKKVPIGKPRQSAPKEETTQDVERPVVMQLCGYPNPRNPLETCGVFTGGEVEQRRHRMKHLFLEWLNMELKRDVPMVFGGYPAHFASCPRCGKFFSRGFAADRHAKERAGCPILPPEQFTDRVLVHARYRRELDKAEKWMYYVPTPVERPKKALVVKAGTQFKISKILEVYETFADRYDMVACKNGTDYEIKFFPENELGGFKWYTSMGRLAYLKGDLRAMRGGRPGNPLPRFREHSVANGTIRIRTPSTSSPVATMKKIKAKVKVEPARGEKEDEEVDMLYAED